MPSAEVVKPADRFFPCPASPDPGTPACVCSRCGAQILAGLKIVSIRFNKPQPALGYDYPGEWRYCRACVPGPV